MAVITIKIGTDSKAVDVTDKNVGIVREAKDAQTFRDFAMIVEKRLPSPSPTIELEKSLALDAIDKSPHFTAEQKAQFSERIRNATEADKIVFLGPFPVPAAQDQVKRSKAQEGAPPPKKSLVVVFIDP